MAYSTLRLSQCRRALAQFVCCIYEIQPGSTDQGEPFLKRQHTSIQVESISTLACLSAPTTSDTQ